MNRNDIIRLANEAYGIEPGDKQLHPSALVHLELFAESVSAQERAACAAHYADIMRKSRPPLTDVQVHAIWDRDYRGWFSREQMEHITRAVEAAHGITGEQA